MADILMAHAGLFRRFMLKRRLHARGHRVTAVRNGAEALEALEQRPYDMLLLDLDVPAVGGYLTADLIRSSRKDYARIPILVVGPRGSSDDPERLRKFGMDGFLPKPCGLDRIGDFVSRNLGPGRRRTG